jgi:hypothetical protein
LTRPAPGRAPHPDTGPQAQAILPSPPASTWRCWDSASVPRPQRTPPSKRTSELGLGWGRAPQQFPLVALPCRSQRARVRPPAQESRAAFAMRARSAPLRFLALTHLWNGQTRLATPNRGSFRVPSDSACRGLAPQNVADAESGFGARDPLTNLPSAQLALRGGLGQPIHTCFHCMDQTRFREY